MRKLLLPILVCMLAACNDAPRNPDPPVRKSPHDSAIPSKAGLPVPNPYVDVDVSPMDMAYFPVEYPKLKMSKLTNEPPVARVIYSRPHLQGRHIFHDVQKYDQPWRLGANESTELDFYRDVRIQGKLVKAGRYIIYSIPHPDKWTIVLNSNVDTWGLEQDSTKDIMRFEIPSAATKERIEYFTMLFEKTDKGASLLMAWDNVEARLPFEF